PDQEWRAPQLTQLEGSLPLGPDLHTLVLKGFWVIGIGTPPPYQDPQGRVPVPAQQEDRGAARPGWRAGTREDQPGGERTDSICSPHPCLPPLNARFLLPTCPVSTLDRPQAPTEPAGQAGAGPAWERVAGLSCPLAPRVGVLLLYFCLFLPPCCLCHAPPHPAFPARLPALQPTDERSWVYSPLHYSVQAHPASDGESDTFLHCHPARPRAQERPALPPPDRVPTSSPRHRRAAERQARTRPQLPLTT
ncbi:hypothetical protein MC885_021111, partial [Smutsia gigantea]